MEDSSRLDLVIDRIERLKGGAYKRLSFEQIRKIAAEILHGHKFISVCFEGGAILRARHFNSLSEVKEKIANTEDILCPKLTMVNHYGRCNWPGNPMLYTSVNLDTALSECRVLTDQYICVGHIAFKENIMAVVVGEADRYRRTKRTLCAVAEQNAKEILESGDTASQLVDAFLNELLTMPCTQPSHYKLTSAFCAEVLNPPVIHRLATLRPELCPITRNFEDHDLVDAICYSSVPHSGGLNFAFKPQAYNKYLELKRCEIWKVIKDYGYGIYAKERVDETEEINGTQIIWKQGKLDNN